jgi:predicted Zn finger-like uncharacterized protein
MITTCTECQARYQLDAEKIPPRVIKVRCPSCGGVFSLDGSQARKEMVEETVPAQEKPQTVTGGPENAPRSVAVERPAARVPDSVPADPPADPPAAPVSVPEPAVSSTFTM